MSEQEVAGTTDAICTAYYIWLENCFKTPETEPTQ